MYVGTTSASPVTELTEWSLDMSADYAEDTCMGDSNKSYVKGMPDVSGTFKGHYDDADDSLYTASQATAAQKMYLYPDRTSATKYWYGTAWVDFSISVGLSDVVDVSGNFKAAGSWAKKP